MRKSEDMFAQLLTEGIQTIKVRQFKSIKIIQDELGYALEKEKGGVSVEYWRKGHIPPDLSDVEKLAREIVKRGNLDKEWLNRFLLYAGHPNPATLANKLFPSEPTGLTQQGTNRLPGKTYREFIGRDALMKEIMSALQDPDGRRIVTVDGLGGMGKTALALEVAEQCLKNHLFEAVVWESAIETGRSDEKYNEYEPLLTFEMILDAIGFQLGDCDISKLKGIEKERQVQTLLGNRRVLVVLDNLETAEESQDKIAQRLRSLLAENKSPACSKVLLTSRYRFKGEVWAIHLTGLNEDDAMRFLCQEGIEQGVKCVETAKSDELKLIARTTGGSPGAMKLIVGQLGHLPLEIVLNRLSEVQMLESKLDQDEYVHFYKSIFFPAWQFLSNNGQQLLLAMTQPAPGVEKKFEALKAISGFADNSLISAIDELWRYSFLEVRESSNLKQVGYYLHALTRYFVLSDMVTTISTITASNGEKPKRKHLGLLI